MTDGRDSRSPPVYRPAKRVRRNVEHSTSSTWAQPQETDRHGSYRDHSPSAQPHGSPVQLPSTRLEDLARKQFAKARQEFIQLNNVSIPLRFKPSQPRQSSNGASAAEPNAQQPQTTSNQATPPSERQQPTQAPGRRQSHPPSSAAQAQPEQASPQAQASLAALLGRGQHDGPEPVSSHADAQYYQLVGEEEHPRPDGNALSGPRSTTTQAQSADSAEGIFHKIMSCPDLIVPFISQLDLPTLETIAAVSKPLRDYMRSGWTHCLKSWAMANCPINWHVAKFTMYSDKCFSDPSGRTLRNRPEVIRSAPRFAYLAMIHKRETTIRSIVRELARHGHRLPSRVKFVLARLWFLMDIPTTARREHLIGIVLQKTGQYYWSNEDLIVATLFLIKLDMRLADRTKGGRSSELRDMLLAHRGLSELDKFLRRDIVHDPAELMAMRAKWKPVGDAWRAIMARFVVNGRVDAERASGLNFLGVPWSRLGVMSQEAWFQSGKKLIGWAELIAAECAKRSLDMPKLYVSMVAWGYVDKDGNEVDVFLRPGEDEDEIDNVMSPIVATRDLLTGSTDRFDPLPGLPRV